MSEAVNFEGANIHAAPPRGYEEMVGWLHCFHNGAACVSAWKLSDEALFQIRNHGVDTVFLSVMSGSQPDGRPIIMPVFVGVEDEVLEVVSDTGKVWK